MEIRMTGVCPLAKPATMNRYATGMLSFFTMIG
jgi:hypothetical protein